MFCSSASLVQSRVISTGRERLSAVIVVDELVGMTAGPEHRAVLVAMAQGWKLLAQFHGLAATPDYRHNQTLMPTPKVASM